MLSGFELYPRRVPLKTVWVSIQRHLVDFIHQEFIFFLWSRCCYDLKEF